MKILLYICHFQIFSKTCDCVFLFKRIGHNNFQMAKFGFFNHYFDFKNLGYVYQCIENNIELKQSFVIFKTINYTKLSSSLNYIGTSLQITPFSKF
jgi:hypothetical protein